MKITFALACITIIVGLIIYFIFFRKKKNIKYNIFIALLTGVIAMTFLVYPLEQEYENVFTRILASLFYAIQCTGTGQDLELLSKIDMNVTNGYIYFIFINALFLIMPLITVSFILTFLENIFVKICFVLLKNKELHIFSDVNDKSLLLAKKLQNTKNVKIIFTDVVDKSKINMKSINMKEKITDIKFGKKTNKIIFYMISENEEENLDKTLELIDKYKNRKNTKINLVNNAEETSTILDSTDKGEITVEIINEKERAIFNLLNDTPLFLNNVNNTISILIVGCGKLGKEFLKDATWCSMMVGYKLEILVIDTRADEIKENINAEAPEFLSNYDITFLNADIKSDKSIDIIKSRNDVNYILVSMDSDDKNLDVAIMLRKLYLREFQREPVINLCVLNEYKKEKISNIVNEKKNPYNLNAFGSLEDLYYHNNIVNSNLEKLAVQIHLFYDPEDTKLERYNLLEYNKRSSRASALHIKYKIYSVLKDLFTEDMKENQRLFKEKYSDKIEELLTINEHERWNAYMRSIGYVCASIDEVESYYRRVNNYVYYLARMHPALVEFDKLDEVSKELSRICQNHIELKDSDRQIVKNIYEKIELY